MLDDPAVDDDRPRLVRGRIVMLVDNGVRGDSRVQKEAVAAADAGWEVILLGRTTGPEEERWEIGKAKVRLIPMPEVLNRRPSDFRRPILRNPLAYPAKEIAQYHARRVAAWRADIVARFAELEVIRRSQDGMRGLRGRRLRLRAELLASRIRGKWVTIRRNQYTKVARRRLVRGGRWDRFVMWFWLTTMKDRAWRRLEPRLWEFELAFGRVIDALRPDIVHANDFYMLPVGARAVLRARAAGRRVALVWDAHELVSGLKARSANIRWLPAHIAIEREYARYADAAMTVSTELAEELQKAHGLPELPTVVLNAPEIHPDVSAPSLREACGVGPDTPLLVYSGAAAPQRGIDTMIDALPHMPEVHVALVVALPPSKFVQDLVLRAESLGVGPRVHLAPYVPFDQVVGYLSEADAGVIPIHHWPNHEIALITKFFEYAHARLPMIVSDVRAMANATRDIGQGEVFRAGDVEDFVRAVKLVLADPNRYRAAYDRPGLLESWTWRAQADVLDRVYSRFQPPYPRLARGEKPQVSVIVPVRNAMPHVSRNIRSLLDQTMGLDNFEVIAIDDGSTDGSGELLDAFARKHPDSFRVVRRTTGGNGPAAAYNLALDVARGRYVLFVGAGDLLGPEALVRMVAAADEHGSDVLAVRMVGVNGRPVPTDLFSESRDQIAVFEPRLAMALSNTKLFRRRLIEHHRLRYPEDVPVGSDQVFTLRACLRARRISVAADYDYYYAVARRGIGAATRTSTLERLHSVERVMALVADEVPAGGDRDTVMRRYFSVELPQLLEELLTADQPTREQIVAGVGRLADTYLTDELARRLNADHRVRLRLAQQRRLDDLVAVVTQDAEPRPAPIVAIGDRLFLNYARLGSPGTGLPAEVAEITHDLAGQVANRNEVSSVRWTVDKDRRPALVIEVDVLLDLDDHDLRTADVTITDVPTTVTLEPPVAGRPGTRLRVTVRLDHLLAQGGEQGARLDPALHIGLADSTGRSPLRMPPDVHPARRFARGEFGLVRVSATRSAANSLIVAITPVTARRVAGKIVRTLLGR